MSLIDWTTSQISALYAPQHSAANAHVDAAAQLTTDLDAAFAPDAEIHLNHAVVDREKFREFVQSRRSAKTQVECKPEDLIETPVEEGNAEVRPVVSRTSNLLTVAAQAGSIVAGKATLIKTLPFLIRAAPAKTTTVLSFSAK
jgi:hypothetical protein